MAPVLASAKQGRSAEAMRRWREVRLRQPRPSYITSTYRLFTDTEQLTDLVSFRNLMENHADERDSVLLRARDALKNRLRVWGNTVMDFGDTVDFNREIGKHGKYGFHYWGWSKPLLQAFVMTGEQRYLECFDRLFTQWYRQRNVITRSIPDFDVVYYELGLATRSRMFIEYDILSGGRLPDSTRERLLKSVLGAARWLYEIQRCEGYRPGNWQMHGSATLVQIALTYPEFAESAGWLALGLQRLQEHAAQDFLEDGGHSEHSPRNYTLATYGLLRNVSYLLNAHGISADVADRLRSRLSLTALWWVTMLTPTGEIPAINDSHRGRFPPRVLEDAASSFGMPEISGVLGSLFSDPPPRGIPRVLPAFTSRHLPASGFTVMRSDWTRDALYMNINHGLSSPTHFHNDILSFELYAFGRALAVDAGIGATYDDPDHFTWFLSSRAHNMVVINDGNLDRAKNQGREIQWDSTSTVQWFTGWHEGYPGYRCRRTVIFVKPSYWLVRDDVASTVSGDTVSWYLHSPERFERAETGWRTGGAPGMWVLPAEQGLVSRLGSGRAASTVDPDPGKTQEASWIRFDRTSHVDSTARFSVFLVPFRSPGDAPLCSVIGPGHLRIVTGEYTDDLYVGGEGSATAGASTDAACFWTRSTAGQLRRLALIDGTFARINGDEVIRLESRGSREVPFH